MGKRIVIALGGNALGNTLNEQKTAVRETAKAIADLIQDGHEVIVAHGNGPQVGMINLAMNADPNKPYIPLATCTAMSQGYIGFDLQNALSAELQDRGISKPVATVLTQVQVDLQDPAFQKPTKPIGSFMTEEQALELQKTGVNVMEDAGRGWRRCVASPKPMAIVEIDTVRALLSGGCVPIACGGGGIPVYASEDGRLLAADAVIDKDFASELLAETLNADALIILTAVEKVAINFGKPDQKWLDRLTPAEARQYEAEGHFAPGSMLPKVRAAVQFAESAPGRMALITLLEKAREGIAGTTGTSVQQ
ncbi:MAG: carbamate kinase [Ruminococcaceae bacterium]|nr:carbamate kinase [Oscillospiraceae bacterium]